MKTIVRRVSLIVGLLACSACGRGGSRAVPIEPVGGVLAAFRSHQIVALGEGLHGNEQGHAFRVALVRDPRAAGIVQDILVEFGNSRYQEVMDRFVQGVDIPYAQLRRVWQNTTNANPLFDGPIYEAFYRAVRDVNLSLPAHLRMRVLLGGPPIDWEEIRTHADLTRWVSGGGRRNQVLEREVLPQKRRTLVIYGDGHLRRYSKWLGDPPGPARPTLLNELERQTRAFNIWTNTTVELERMQRNIASWPAPSLTMLRGTRLGALDFKYFAGMQTDPPTRMEDQFDAVLYLGPVSSITTSELSPALCADADYVRMRLSRLALSADGPEGHDATAFRKFCPAS